MLFACLCNSVVSSGGDASCSVCALNRLTMVTRLESVNRVCEPKKNYQARTAVRYWSYSFSPVRDYCSTDRRAIGGSPSVLYRSMLITAHLAIALIATPLGASPRFTPRRAPTSAIACSSSQQPDGELLPAPEGELRERLVEMQQRNAKRGAVVLAALVVVILWSFSVPPSIRRATLCELGDTPDCLPAATLAGQVAEHYQTCGRGDAPACVKFDFSIDPDSSAAFYGAVDALASQAGEAATPKESGGDPAR